MRSGDLHLHYQLRVWKVTGDARGTSGVGSAQLHDRFMVVQHLPLHLPDVLLHLLRDIGSRPCGDSRCRAFIEVSKVVVVGKDGAARSRLVNLLQSAKYRVEVKDGDGGLSVLETGGEVWSIGPVQVDVARMAVIQADGTSVRLLPRELKILGLLTAEPGAVVSRETLMNEAWGFDYYGTTRTVDQTIANLRKKLGGGLTIESVRGEGYRLTDGTEE